MKAISLAVALATVVGTAALAADKVTVQLD